MGVFMDIGFKELLLLLAYIVLAGIGYLGVYYSRNYVLSNKMRRIIAINNWLIVALGIGLLIVSYGLSIHIVVIDGNEYIYKGKLKQGIADGYGKLYTNNYPKALVYEGEFVEDKLNGYGCIYKYDKLIYKGEIVNNVPDGKGLFPDIIEAYEFSHGKWMFRGLDEYIEEYKYITMQTAAYEGEVKSGLANGRGKLILDYSPYGDNSYFSALEGNFIDGQFNYGNEIVEQLYNSYKQNEIEPMVNMTLRGFYTNLAIPVIIKTSDAPSILFKTKDPNSIDINEAGVIEGLKPGWVDLEIISGEYTCNFKVGVNRFITSTTSSESYPNDVWPEDSRGNMEEGYSSDSGSDNYDYSNTHHVDPHWVDSYTRSDGTQVDGYWRGGFDGYERSNPDDSTWNNLNPFN
ncbi:MAG: hypothetical protein K0S61_559 [Anaerocolumna sp.]|jgi:hypothetical protein|nr:hypothetical protein [Anaerocolumna sp.]